jgi:Domain of unknown function (DUF5666)
MKYTIKHFPSLALAALALSISACGGGGSSGTNSPVATNAASEKEFVAGTVSGFGSVIVEGVRYDDSSAKVQIEYDPAAPKSAPVSDLKLGMQVVMKVLKTGAADTVVSSAEVLGPITSLTSDGFVVAGQNVKVSTDAASPTVFDGIANLASLAVNDRVEVHGARDANNNIVATRIERKNPSDIVMTRVVGTIANLNVTNKTFTVGGLVVTYSDLTKVLPATATAASLINGQVVAVFSLASPSANGITAKSISVKKSIDSINPIDADKAWVSGHIRDLNFSAKTFNLKGFSVDASAATFSNGTANDLANARKVRVVGIFENGTLKASAVKFAKSQGDAQVDLLGAITSFVSASSFTLRGVPIDASSSGITFVNGTAANLAQGVTIKISGASSDSVVKPTTIEFVTTPESRQTNFFGEVKNYSAVGDTFTLMNVNMKLAANAVFKNSDQSASTKAEFGNTDKVQVKGAFTAGLFEVSEVVFRNGPAAVITRIEGGVTTFDAATGVFKINGTTVRTTTGTTFDGTISNLRTGTRVEVEGTIVNGELVARTIEFHDAEDNVSASVTGIVSDFVSISDLRINGQKVDASKANAESSALARLANGVIAEAKGKVVNGVLLAERVRVR